MELRWFDGWTEPLPVNGFSQMEITITTYGVQEIPLLNCWRVDRHSYFGSDKIFVSYRTGASFHEIWSEHVQGKDWKDIWSMVGAAIHCARESMLP